MCVKSKTSIDGKAVVKLLYRCALSSQGEHGVLKSTAVLAYAVTRDLYK